jgi:F0F1-type ATP synthase membrane subunit a
MEHMIENNSAHAAVEHVGPHIPAIQWEQVFWFISNTSITTIAFAILVIIFTFFANRVLKNDKKSKLKTWVLTFIKFFDEYLRDSFDWKTTARKYLPLVVWIFVIIFFGNLFGLAIDWAISAFPTMHIQDYLRPMHSDLNTTLVLAAITVVTFLWVAIKTHWIWHTAKWYLFNFKWDNFWEKCVNVFVWWLHLIWVPATLASLSLRLFGNIFAWIVLIWVITYLGQTMTESLFQTWRFLSIPFWFFEFFVAFVQSVVFAALIISYINQAKEEH